MREFAHNGLLLADQYIDCISALHHNKRKTNYHIHLIFSERNYLDEPIEKIATRNMFYNEKGSHVRTKKEILDENGSIRKLCKVIKKGEVYERQLFTIKDKRFKGEAFLDEAKVFYTDLMNELVKDENQKLSVFKRGDVYLATKKIGKNNPKETEIKESNLMVKNWNETVDHALVSGISRGEILNVKKEQIGSKVQSSIKENGRNPSFFLTILIRAVDFLGKAIREYLRKSKNKTTEEQASNPTEVIADSDKSIEAKQETPAKEDAPIPPRPKAPTSISKLNQMIEIDEKLKKQNSAITKIDINREEVASQIEECKGIFKLTKKAKLQEEYDSLTNKLKNMKSKLGKIVKEYGYKNVDEFYKIFNSAVDDYNTYQTDLRNWETTYSEKSVLRLLNKNKEMIKQRDNKKSRKVYIDRDTR